MPVCCHRRMAALSVAAAPHHTSHLAHVCAPLPCPAGHHPEQAAAAERAPGNAAGAPSPGRPGALEARQQREGERQAVAALNTNLLCGCWKGMSAGAGLHQQLPDGCTMSRTSGKRPSGKLPEPCDQLTTTATMQHAHSANRTQDIGRLALRQAERRRNCQRALLTSTAV